MVRLSDVRVTVLQCYKVLPACLSGLGLSATLSILSRNGRLRFEAALVDPGPPNRKQKHVGVMSAARFLRAQGPLWKKTKRVITNFEVGCEWEVS